MNMKIQKMAAWLRAGPLFPFIPIVPAAIMLGSVALSVFSLVRARRLESAMGAASP